MRISKNIAACLCLLGAITSLSACGNKAPETNSPPPITSLDDIYGRSIGVLRNSQADLYTVELASADGPEACDIVYFDDETEMARQVDKGEIAAAIIDTSRAEYWCNQDDDLYLLDELYYYDGYGIAINMDNDPVIEEINNALGLMEEDGVLKEISDYWNDSKNPQKVSSRKDAAGQNWTGFPIYEDPIFQYDKSLHVITCSGFPPFVSETSDGKLIGIDMDILYALGQYLKMDIELTFGDYEAMLSCVQDESADVAIGAIPTSFIPEGCELSAPYYVTSLGILTRQ